MIETNAVALAPWLRRLMLRSVLNEEEQGVLLTLPTETRRIDVNRDFVKLGQTIDHACLVVDGLVGRFGQTRKGDRQITALYLAGDMADLHSVVVPKTDWALQALSSTTIVQVPHAALTEAADRHPAIAHAFWRDCVVDASIIARWHVSLGRRDARARLAHMLCELACRYEMHGLASGDEFELTVTQVHLADILGMTSVHVNRTLGTMKREGLISIQDKRLRMLDRPALVAIAGFDKGYLHLERPRQP